MSFDKPYPNRKDKRRPYHKSRAFDRSCRHGGSCSWCRNNRMYSRNKIELALRVEFKETA